MTENYGSENYDQALYQTKMKMAERFNILDTIFLKTKQNT